MEDKEYRTKTQPMVNFLMHIFDEGVGMIANIQVAQAEQNTEWLIDLFELVKCRIEDWIAELKALEKKK